MTETAYDPARRKRAKRGGRERGCWIYIPKAELERAGFVDVDLDDGPPFYRTNGYQRSANAGSVIVSLYREA